MVHSGEIMGALAVLSGEPSLFTVRTRHFCQVGILSKKNTYEWVSSLMKFYYFLFCHCWFGGFIVMCLLHKPKIAGSNLADINWFSVCRNLRYACDMIMWYVMCVCCYKSNYNFFPILLLPQFFLIFNSHSIIIITLQKRSDRWL